MKRSFLTLLFLASFSMYLIYAQSNIDSTNETQIWKIFASGVCDFNTFETGEIKQNFIDVKQVGNKFYWGEDNVFTIYNKKEKHSGFMSITTYDFIDKFKQRGIMIYQYNRNADWSTKHMYYIQYEGIVMGMVYLSNDPFKK